MGMVDSLGRAYWGLKNRTLDDIHQTFIEFHNQAQEIAYQTGVENNLEMLVNSITTFKMKNGYQLDYEVHSQSRAKDGYTTRISIYEDGKRESDYYNAIYTGAINYRGQFGLSWIKVEGKRRLFDDKTRFSPMDFDHLKDDEKEYTLLKELSSSLKDLKVIKSNKIPSWQNGNDSSSLMPTSEEIAPQK